MFSKVISAWRKRSMPTNLEGIRGLEASSYSQFGEDVVVRSILGSDTGPGFYVDVGCFHPIRWSNTYALYLQGWSGICIDPNRTYAGLWKRLRPRDRFLDVAISTTTGQAAYIEDPQPAQNRISMEIPVSSVGQRTVKTRRLDELLREQFGEHVSIELMSIDCEGHDLSVLMSNDFRRYRPRVLIVEDEEPLTMGALHDFTVSIGYRLVAATRMSRVYEDAVGARFA